MKERVAEIRQEAKAAKGRRKAVMANKRSMACQSFMQEPRIGHLEALSTTRLGLEYEI